MKPGIEIQIEWWDNDVNIFWVRGSNGAFSGEAMVYLAPGALIDFAESLRGFPTSTSDQRNLELGAFDTICAGGAIQMHFHCLDSAGHAVVDVKFRSEKCTAFGELESAMLRIPLQAAAIDAFVEELQKTGQNPPPSIFLPMAA